MDHPSPQCAGIKKNGERCKNRAVAGSAYCRVHQDQAVAAAEAAAPPPVTPAVPRSPELERAQVEAVAEELNKLADEVRAKAPDYTPPPFSAAAMVNVLKANMEQLAAYLPVGLIKEIIHNLEGTKKEDLLDPDTWKGLWYILTYSLSTQSKTVLEEVARRLTIIPGMDMVLQLGQSVWESPGDLLSVDTWRGAAVILSAAVQANVSSLRRRVLGGSEDD
jgi:hypothetical protein